MAIRKPNLSVTETKRLAAVRAAATGQIDEPVAAPPPLPPAPPPSSSSTPSRAAEAPPAGEMRPSTREGDTRSPVSTVPSTGSDMPSLAAKAPSPGTLAGNAVADAGTPPSSIGAPPLDVGARATSAKLPPRGTRPATPPRRAPPPPLVGARSAKVQVFLSAPLPAPGVSPVFEMLCRQYSPQKALQMILRRALDDYEELLENGGFQKLATIYATDETDAAVSIVQTSRMIPMALLAVARAHFDPLGLESTRAFGRKLGTAALAASFSRDGKRHV